MILWGPPGVGKTTLAGLVAKEARYELSTLSAVSSGVKDVRALIEKVEKGDLFTERKQVLFIDEIHRFSKSQQDSLLGAVERGSITLIGATTENPAFEVISPLLSRCQVYILKPLSKTDQLTLVNRALDNDEALKARQIALVETDALLGIAGGDARKLLNLIDLVSSTEAENIEITNELITRVVQHNARRFDKGGDMHYDIASAFIKSIRGSSPDAAVYWLARMLDSGEDVKFIARRIIIAAAEDIGNANPTALVMANNCFQAVSVVGMPEARIILSQTVLYLACSAKSNSAYTAINRAQEVVARSGDLPVPLHLRNPVSKLSEQQGIGGYEYPHDFNYNFIDQEYLPQELKGTSIYEPGANAREDEYRKLLDNLWKKERNVKGEGEMGGD